MSDADDAATDRLIPRELDQAVRIVEQFAAGAQGPPLLEAEVLHMAAKAAENAIARGESAARIMMAVVYTITDERLGYQRLVRLEDVARALGADPPRGTIDEATERSRRQAEALARDPEHADREVLDRDAEREQIAAAIADLDFTEELQAEGRPWAEADDDGALVMCDPEEGAGGAQASEEST